jgi:hypothetical protein
MKCHEDCFTGRYPLAFKRCDGCDALAETALFASEAMLKERIVGWSPSASYMEERNMQEDLGVLQETHQEEAIPEQNPVASATPLISTNSHPSNATSSQDAWTKAARKCIVSDN